MGFKRVLDELGIEMDASDAFFCCADEIARTDLGFVGKFVEFMGNHEKGDMELQYLENYTTEAMREKIIVEATEKGSTAFRRRCVDCGRALDVLVLRDDSSPGGVALLLDDAVYFGRFYIDEETAYEKWLCAEVGCFDVEHGFRCRRSMIEVALN